MCNATIEQILWWALPKIEHFDYVMFEYTSAGLFTWMFACPPHHLVPTGAVTCNTPIVVCLAGIASLCSNLLYKANGLHQLVVAAECVHEMPTNRAASSATSIWNVLMFDIDLKNIVYSIPTQPHPALNQFRWKTNRLNAADKKISACLKEKRTNQFIYRIFSFIRLHK